MLPQRAARKEHWGSLWMPGGVDAGRSGDRCPRVQATRVELRANDFISCDNFCNVIEKYAVWEPKDNSEWNTENDLLGISKKAKDCLSNIIFDLQSRKNTNVDFYRDLELPVE